MRARRSRAQASARGRVVGLGDGRPEHAQRGVALELVDQALALVHGLHDRLEELVEHRHHALRAWARASEVEPTMSTNSADTSQLAPPSAVPRSSASRATSAPTWRP